MLQEMMRMGESREGGVNPQNIEQETILCSENKYLPIRGFRTVQVDKETLSEILNGGPVKIDGEVGEIVRFAPGIRGIIREWGQVKYLPPEFEKIPKFLSDRKNFCLRGGKDGKQPFIKDWRGNKDGFTSLEWDKHKDSWLYLNEALRALKEHKEFSGIGYLNGNNKKASYQNIVGGDLDACVDPVTGEVSHFAQDTINLLQPFYYEMSPSGCGIRFFVDGKLPGKLNPVVGNGDQDLSEEMKEHILSVKPGVKKFNGFELYTSKRHLTITGEYLGGSGLAGPKDSQIFKFVAKFRNIDTTLSKMKEQGFVETSRTKEGYKGYIPANDKFPEQWFYVREHHGPSACDEYTIIEPINASKSKDVTLPEGAKSKRWGFPSLDILKIAKSEGFHPTGISGDNILGYFDNPGSTTGKNISIDASQGIFCYLHDGLNTGGDVWNMLGRLSGAIKWEDKAEGAFRNEGIKRVVAAYAIGKGYAKLWDFSSSIARSVCEADISERLAWTLDNLLDRNPDLKEKFYNPDIEGGVEIYKSLFEKGLSESDVREIMELSPNWKAKDESYRAETIKKGLEEAKKSAPRIREVSREDPAGTIGVNNGIVVKVTKGEKKDLQWISDCALHIDTETAANGSTEFLFVGRGAKDGREASFSLQASEVVDSKKFRTAVINALGTYNRVGRLDFEIVQQLSINRRFKRRVEVPIWDGNMPLIPGMNVGDDIEFKLSKVIPAEVKKGD